MRVGLIGAGNIARALARGWGDPVLVCDAGSGRAQSLADELGGEAVDSSLEVARGADLVVLCHKPAQLSLVAQEIAGESKPIVSVLGGVSLEALQAAYPDRSVFRTEPNTPVEVRRGVVSFCPAEGVPADLERDVIALFDRLGEVFVLPESLFGAAGAISGVGPAYQALLAEAQVDAGIRYGLKADLAGRLVAETMAGTAALIAHRGYDTLAVRREVTSPGGSTARGLAALERAGVRAAFQDAMDALFSRRAS
jgi:pyrroline-5-carboxylate reductase